MIRTLSFSYLANGSLASASDPAATYGYTLDNLGRVIEEDQDLAGQTPLIEFNSRYNANGRRTELQALLGGTNDFKNTYSYDNLARLTSLKQEDVSGGNVVADKRVDFAYDVRSQLTKVSRFADVAGSQHVASSHYTTDNLGRLTKLVHSTSTTPPGSGWGTGALAGYQYVYDAASRITSIDSFADGLTSFTHDNTDQLKTADHTGQTDESYSYDLNGNRTMTGHSVGDNNRLLSDGTYNYTYDDEGNRLTKTKISTGEKEEYTWDHRNRLTKVTFKNSGGTVLKTVDQTYDVFNRWIRRAVDADGPGSGVAVDTFFNHENGQIVLDFDGPAASDLTHRYLWSEAIDQILASEDVTSLLSAGNVLSPLTDHLGTTRDIADRNESTGVTTVTNHRRFDSYGILVSETNTGVDLVFGYTGRPFDDSTGLNNNLNRWYAFGIWLSEDPIGFNGGDENLSRYVHNNPVSFTDPLGLWEFGFPILLTGGSWTWGNGQTRETMTVWDNTQHMPTPQRVYVTGGTTAGTFVGVRGVSDACSRHDAVDAHEQSVGERVFDGVTGSVQLVGTGVGIKGMVMPSPAGTATILHHPGDPLHASIQVTKGTTTVHTHQVVTSANMSSTKIVTAAQAPPGPVTASATVRLPNAQAALARQAQLMKQGNLGTYNKVTNSCVSHVADVAKAGGATPTPPAPFGSAQLRWFLNLFKGKKG